MLRSSPTLKTLFLAGQRLSKPFAKGNAGGSGDGEGTGGGSKREEREKREFFGKRHPTFFEVKGVQPGEIYERKCEIGRRCRIKFQTDFENSYFDRATDRGNIRA